MKMGTGTIDHVIVVMMENHSFDSVLGWLYADQGNQPPLNIPAPAAGAKPTFDGLAPQSYWNAIPPGNTAAKVFASRGTVGAGGTPDYTAPDPNPNELFSDMTAQIFGSAAAGPGDPPTMDGFLANYATAPKVTAPRLIMQSYDPGQLPVHTWLARNFAVCDRWFGSSPTETFPNRSFLHAGTSFGRVNGCDTLTETCVPPTTAYKGNRTVFHALSGLGQSWKVYNDSILVSSARYQFGDLFSDGKYDPHFKGFGQFVKDAASGSLPTYSFIEPSFLIQPNDGHPPHDMRSADTFLSAIWDAVRTSPKWANIVWVITYDEHGGCYDHVAPPQNAINPDASVPQYPFNFQRFGPRVPTIVVSAWIEPGTVFRAGPGESEFDHTSILATLRDLLGLDAWPAPFQSRRVDRAPTLDRLLTLSTPRAAPPAAPTQKGYIPTDLSASTPLNQIQRAQIAGTVAPQAALASVTERIDIDQLTLGSEAEAIAFLSARGFSQRKG
jgi:phospholipase C